MSSVRSVRSTELQGKVLKNGVAVPRAAVHNNNEIWVVENNRLRMKPFDIVRTDRDFAYATSGLDDGAMIAVSALDAATDRMRVRTQAKTENQMDDSQPDSNRPQTGGTD